MQWLDVNVLIYYAHREDGPEHDLYAAWLQRLVDGPEPFALSPLVLSSFCRIVTNTRVFHPATPMATALEFCERLVQWPRSVLVFPSDRHWKILANLCRSTSIRGPLVTDACVAALAIEHGCELVTTDSDFTRFEGLR